METKARFTLIGLFTLAVIAAGFGFVYWLQTTGGLGARSIYRIRFESPVAGLLIGSSVLFNGIKVGEVTRLGLDQENPKRVDAEIAIDPATPVRVDTHVGIDFQGLTGAPVVMLTGGSASAALLTGSSREPALLSADPQAGQSLTQAARDSLKQLDAVMTENSAPLHEAMTNLSTFAQALGRNSNRVDAILAGLERMTAGAAAKARTSIFELVSAPPLHCPNVVPGPLVIPEPTSLLALNSDKIVVTGADGSAPALENAQWADVVPVLIHVKLIQSFENSGCFGTVSRPLEGLVPGHQLLTEIRTFRFTGAPAPQAEIELSTKVLVGEGQIAATRVFHETAPAAATDATSVVAAFNTAFLRIVTELELWTAQSMQSLAKRKEQP